MGEMISFGHMSFITLPFIITFQPFELSRRMPAFVCDMNTDRAKSFLLIPLQFCLRVKRIIPVSSRANSRNLFKFFCSFQLCLWASEVAAERQNIVVRQNNYDRTQSDLTLNNTNTAKINSKIKCLTFVFKDAFLSLGFIGGINAFEFIFHHNAKRGPLSVWLKRSESHLPSDSFVYMVLWHHQIHQLVWVTAGSAFTDSPAETMTRWHLQAALGLQWLTRVTTNMFAVFRREYFSPVMVTFLCHWENQQNARRVKCLCVTRSGDISIIKGCQWCVKMSHNHYSKLNKGDRQLGSILQLNTYFLFRRVCIFFKERYSLSYFTS